MPSGMIARFTVIAGDGPELLFPTLPTAVRAYQDRTKDPPAGNQGPCPRLHPLAEGGGEEQDIHTEQTWVMAAAELPFGTTRPPR
jgi:hypothetical protein